MENGVSSGNTAQRHMTPPRHTPYAGPSRPFTIGLGALNPDEWIEKEPDLNRYLNEKHRLWSENAGLVFQAEDDTDKAQQETLDALVRHLLQTQPETYTQSGSVIRAGQHAIDLNDGTLPPLAKAGFLVADDLVIMRKKEAGWSLVAAHLSFPSSWSLAEKFGHTMDEIHGPVPGFAAGTRNASLISRMFDNLSTPVWRMNWSLNPNDQLFLPKPKVGHNQTLQPPYTPERIFLRIERQSLTRLPVSRDIVFTIRIHVDPLSALLNHEQAETLGNKLADQVEELDDIRIMYKGIAHNHRELVAIFRNFAKNR
ncbi:MAG: hypothetical protein RIR97_2057 [Pseudomonadota bacterium]